MLLASVGWTVLVRLLLGSALKIRSSIRNELVRSSIRRCAMRNWMECSIRRTTITTNRSYLEANNTSRLTYHPLDRTHHPLVGAGDARSFSGVLASTSTGPRPNPTLKHPLNHEPVRHPPQHHPHLHDTDPRCPLCTTGSHQPGPDPNGRTRHGRSHHPQLDRQFEQ